MTAPIASTGEAPTARQGRLALLSAATLSQFGASVLQQGTVVLGVFFAAAYHLTLAQMGLMIATMTIGLMFSGLGIGPAVDFWGSRRVLFIGTIALTVCTAAVTISPNLVVTVALLFGVGLALGAVPLSGTKAIMTAWTRERRGLPTGIRQSGVPLGALVASLILPSLATQFGLKPIYAGFAVIVALCGFLFCAILPRQTARPERGQARLTAAEARRMVIPCICGFLLAWGQYALLTFTIPMLQRNGLSVAIGGELLALAQVGGAAARFALGGVSDRYFKGRREHVLLGSAVAGIAFALILAFLPRAIPFWALAILWTLFGGAFVGWNALALTWAGERITDARVGAALGLETSAILCGASVTTPVFGAVVERSGTFTAGWLTLGVIMAVASVLLWIEARKPELAPSDALPIERSTNSEVL